MPEEIYDYVVNLPGDPPGWGEREYNVFSKLIPRVEKLRLDGSADNLLLKWSDSIGGTVKTSIREIDGMVGIGTISPSNRLSVHSNDSGENAIQVTSANTGNSSINSGARLGVDAQGSSFISFQGYGHFYIKTNSLGNDVFPLDISINSKLVKIGFEDGTTEIDGITETLSLKCTGSWQEPFQMSNYCLWVDSSGKLRIKSGTPSSDTDGAVVGAQS
jgi:hypothetical protein